jgi:hypothetical protein
MKTHFFVSFLRESRPTLSKRHLHLAHAQASMSKRQPPTPQTILLFFGTLPQNRGGGMGWGRAAAVAKTRSSSSAPGKRDKYRYEVECVTGVPIGCILNR